MTCTICGHNNSEGASFCSNCGSPLGLRCPSCESPYEAGASFCSNCGTRLAAADVEPVGHFARYLPPELQRKLEAARTGRTMVGERRTITVLFADVQGSTAAAERLDPEEWADVVNGAFERLIRPVYRYEGTLARLMGDAILAFFGAPIAHEDDPERAIMAGLEMVRAARPYAREVEQEWGIEFDLRVGINTGLVVVGEVGSDLRVEYTALGDAVNVAARMEQTAAPGTVQITESTQRLVHDLFEFEVLEPVVAKGKAEPVAAYRVIGAAPAAPSQGFLGRETRMIGRARELATLRTVIDRLGEGRGQICTLIGEAGVGKSKLAAALKADLVADRRLATWPTATADGQLRWAEARCLSYDTNVPYAPFRELFAGLFEIEPDERVESQRARVRAAVADVVADPREIATYIGVMLGIDPEPDMADVIADLEPPALQRQVFSAVVSYLEACTLAGPGVLVLEDLHWADPVSLALLEELMEVTDRSILAILALMRPYRDDPSWGFHETGARDFQHRYTTIRLEPLDDASARSLASEILDGAELPEELHELISNRADGNPFFVEEILRVMMESGTLTEHDGRWVLEPGDPATAIPTTINGLLNARLDRLDEGARHLLQLASVLGREFEFAELQQLDGGAVDVERTVGDLMRRDLLVEIRRIPTRVHAFRHALIQETAYDTILLKTRRSLHAMVADHLIERGAEPHEIARHLLRAGQQARAVPFLADAGDQASRAMSLADAIRHYSSALEFASDRADLQLMRRIYEGLGTAYTLIPDLTEASTSYQRMLEVGREHADPTIQVAALNRLGFMAVAMGGDYGQAMQHLETARRLAEESDDRLGLAQNHMMSCLIATSRGDLEAAAEHDAETVQAGDQAGLDRIRLGGLVQRAMTLVMGAEYEEAMLALEAAKSTAGADPLPNVKSMLLTTEALLLTCNGEIARAWEMMQANAEETVRIGSSKASNVALIAAGTAELAGHVEHALALHAQAKRLGEETGQLFNSAAAAAAMARLYAELGMEGADRFAAAALEHLQVPFGDMLSSSVLVELGRLAAIEGRLDDAVSMLTEGVDGASATKLHETSGLLLGLADVRIAQGDLGSARELIEEAIAFTSQRQMRHRRPAEALTMARLLASEGRIDEAEAELEIGRREAASMGAGGLELKLTTALARMQAEAGRATDAEHTQAVAEDLIRRQANEIVDDDLRRSFAEAVGAELPVSEPSTSESDSTRR